MSKRLYDDAALAKLADKTVEYGGKMYTEYEIRQMQRALERQVRKAKRQFLTEQAAGVDTTRASARLRDARRALNGFLDATGGKLSAARTDVAGFGTAQAHKSNQDAKSI